MGEAFVAVNTECSFRLSDDTNAVMNNRIQAYGIPVNYNPADHPPVRMRHHNHNDQSETQRKRRSKNRLSNRRSTGFVPAEMVEEALKMGDQGADKV